MHALITERDAPWTKVELVALVVKLAGPFEKIIVVFIFLVIALLLIFIVIITSIASSV